MIVSLPRPSAPRFFEILFGVGGLTFYPSSLGVLMTHQAYWWIGVGTGLVVIIGSMAVPRVPAKTKLKLLVTVCVMLATITLHSLDTHVS